jgi:hypothetical protein
MALHRDIYWVGRQWAVTGYGVQACDQRRKSKFDIEASLLWEDDVLESLRAHDWLNKQDFEKALSVARDRFPEPPRKAAPPAPDAVALPLRNASSAAPPAAIKPALEIEQLKKPENPKSEAVASPKLLVPKFAMRFAGSGKFARPWRVQLKR